MVHGKKIMAHPLAARDSEAVAASPRWGILSEASELRANDVEKSAARNRSYSP